ncbi:MAG: anthranilate synthase component I family protein [Saprospiraceae bacterium]
MNITTYSEEIIADLTTPVSLYLKIREKYGQAHLLETSAYSIKEGSKSMICFNELASFQVDKGILKTLDIEKQDFNIYDEVQSFLNHFHLDQNNDLYGYQAIFGYTSYSAIQYFENIKLDDKKIDETIPDIRYGYYRNLVIFDHFHETMIILDNCPEGKESNLAEVTTLIHSQFHLLESFATDGEEYSNMTDEDYMHMVTLGKKHCKRGDVFQMVLSRKYYLPYIGDDFNVYRALRSINPSPYLFYFNYVDYRIFGSSPEAQLKIEDGYAEIHPIAGTYRRTGDDALDKIKAQELAEDPKEVAEHVMLVDLARNDLSRNSKEVKVVDYKIIQYFSHVIHLVSKVVGKVKDKSKSVQIYGDTFPAGTLSGAPKYKAMSLINQYEPNGRSFYGGGIGLIKFDGGLDHAIIIRSFLSKDNVMIRQAGAGIVMKSNEENELQEVNNKLAALKKAISFAEKI